MNKTIIINMNGIVFHIEEDAYEILKSYMTDVKRHFMNSADSLEITTDIENRIAEMFNEMLANEHKQVINEADVRKVIEQMGTVEDFEIADEDAKSTYTNYNGTATSRRLFRDPDDHLVGGVCAGIANYFDVQPVWIRLAFAITAFGAGSGLIVYIILWAVVPKAASRADRMAMKGERLDLKGFKKNFEEEMSGLRSNLSDFSNEARPLVYKTRDFIGDFFYHLASFFRGAGRVLVKIFGVIILIACFGMLIALIVAIVAFLAFNNSGLYHLFPFNLANHDVNTAFLICSFLALSIPVLTIILLILSTIFNSRSFSKASGSTLLIIWILAVCIVGYQAARISSNFREVARITQTINIKPTKDNVYYLKLNDIKYFSAEDSLRYHLKEKFHGPIILDMDDDDMRDWPGRNVGLEIIKSDVAQPVLEETFEARGSLFEEALSNAQSIAYRFVQTDSTLLFDRRIQKPLNRLFRDQNLHMRLKLPLNSRVIVEEDLDRILDGGISVSNCNTDNNRDNSLAATFNITNNGLQCKIDTMQVKREQAKTDSVKTDTVRK